MLETLVTIAQLATLLLIPAVIYAARILSHVQRVERFMESTEKAIHRLNNTVQSHETQLAVLEATKN